MSILMSIVEQLGINHTYFFQFFIFIFALLVLSQFVFKDFATVIKKRELKTSGGDHALEHGQKKAAEISRTYEEKAKQINNEIKSVFDYYKNEANAEYEKNVSSARASALKIVEEARQKVASEIGDASQKLKEEAPVIAKEIMKKLVGSEGKKA